MPGITFDRAVAYYDATRGLPEGVDAQLRDAIIERAGVGLGSRWLELGIGTGRVALPFLRAGADYTGLDLSLPMMAELRRKLGADPLTRAIRPKLVRGDAMFVPFRDAAFDAVVMVHVLHLVTDWRAALAEALRVVRPGGALVLIDNDRGRSRDPDAGEASLNQLVGGRWSAIKAELGYTDNPHRHGIRALDDEVLAELRARGAASAERVTLVEYAEPPRTAREIAARFIGRIYSSEWETPEDIHNEAAHRLQQWLDAECPNPDEPVSGTARIRAVFAKKA
jgi:SAM-dependent methyltransferase